MGEGNANIEVSSQLRERQPQGESDARAEILEAVLLAVVAVATAFSGYQAARFDGLSGRDYATASRYRVQSEQAPLASNQTVICFHIRGVRFAVLGIAGALIVYSVVLLSTYPRA